MNTITIEIDGRTFTVQHAATTQDRTRGLARVKELPADGMLFSYNTPVWRPFYMQMTYMPLVIAFFDEDGKFISSRTMEPMSLNPHLAKAPFKYAVEFPADSAPVFGSDSRLVLPG
jgi:uncharacterized membrane protein (UPF0127 family)